MRGGVDDVGDPAVVLIYENEVVLCTGTLVSPTVVLTAAHCVDPAMLGAHAVTELEVRFGAKLYTPDATAHVAEAAIHPDWDITDTTSTTNPDLAILRLTAPVTDVAPIPLPAAGIEAALVVGAPLRAIGYGITENGKSDYGTKREAPTAVSKLDGQAIYTKPVAMCEGDSGAPYLFDQDGKEVLAAVHSRGNCLTSARGYRTDLFLSSFIQPFIDADCKEDARCDEACTADPDCDATGEGGGGAGGGTAGATEPSGGCSLAEGATADGSALFAVVAAVALVVSRARSRGTCC